MASLGCYGIVKWLDYRGSAVKIQNEPYSGEAGIFTIPKALISTIKNPDRPGVRVDIPIHSGEILAPKTLKSILEHAGLSVEEFIKLLRG